MFHADNAYYLPAARIVTKRMKTNTVSNTAFRGFGGPQGMIAIERVLDDIAWSLGLDPLDVRKANFYGPGRDMTPYGMQITDNIAPELILEALEASSDYRARRKAVAAFNAESRYLKRGIALMPIKFGISFTTTFLNQAGALVHVYQDGSVHLNHGGTEMGRGCSSRSPRSSPRSSASISTRSGSRRPRPPRCPTPRRPRRRRAPTSTAWPRARPPLRSRAASSTSRPRPMRCRPTASRSSTTRC